MLEAGAVIAKDGRVLAWHAPHARSSAYLPDSRDLWGLFWENRGNILGFAHSHPGGGVPGPSHEDVTTFAAVEAALGRRLLWWIVSSDHTSLVQWGGPEKLDYSVSAVEDLDWTEGLRLLSKMSEKQE